MIADFEFYQFSTYVLLGICAVFVAITVVLGVVLIRSRPRRKGPKNSEPAPPEGAEIQMEEGQIIEEGRAGLIDNDSHHMVNPTQDKDNEEYCGHQLLDPGTVVKEMS